MSLVEERVINIFAQHIIKVQTTSDFLALLQNFIVLFEWQLNGQTEKEISSCFLVSNSKNGAYKIN